METIEHGASGLFYVTDSEERAIFIAAPTEAEARNLVAQARLALLRGLNIHNHTLHDYKRGGRLYIPDPIAMTPEQRQETITRMTKHLMERFNP